jgi:hypothetical protein
VPLAAKKAFECHVCLVMCSNFIRCWMSDSVFNSCHMSARPAWPHCHPAAQHVCGYNITTITGSSIVGVSPRPWGWAPSAVGDHYRVGTGS